VIVPEFATQADCSQVLPAPARVDEIYQAAVALFYLEDCSYKDIAVILDVPIGTVKSRIARGIAQLREILLPDGSRGSALHKEVSSSRANADEAAAPSENTLPRSCRRAQLAVGATAGGFEEWDLRTTCLREQSGAL